ncbi:SPFH/Band 7/PHB domain protein [Ancylostoma duodenale]|uniref:SPFH/Band 7/PHB domain protein n=1 Tax=Ancylostoma duodenale TaxID=51022 RepID=A0A0C2DFR2_9BILA|nr:SPFH/Band 7/PHB domain protein [Ancylostoma duodenale]
MYPLTSVLAKRCKEAIEGNPKERVLAEAAEGGKCNSRCDLTNSKIKMATLRRSDGEIRTDMGSMEKNSTLQRKDVVQEYERAVIFRLGRLMPGGAKGPGIFFVLPCIDSYKKIDLRVVSFDVPPQEILSKDSVTVAVDAVVYFRISNATISVTNVEDASRSTKLLAQTTLRNILGTRTLAEMLSDREAISHQMQCTLDEATDPWGVKVERVEVKDVRLPLQLQRAMAAEAEATREAGAKVIAAEGEQKASQALREAAEVVGICFVIDITAILN